MAIFRLLRADGAHVLNETIEMAGEKPLQAAGACATFHQRLMSPSIALTQSELNSLDGAPFAARARETVDKLLDPVRAKAQQD